MLQTEDDLLRDAVDLTETVKPQVRTALPPARARRRRRRLIATAVVLQIAAILVALVVAIRYGLIPASLLPPDLRRLILLEAPEPPKAPEVPVNRDPITSLPPPVLAWVFNANELPSQRFARTPYIDVSAMCAILNVTGLANAKWAPDPVIPAEWACFTDVLSVGGDVEEPPSTVFGLIRGRNRGVADVLRLTVIESGPKFAAEARSKARDVIASVLDLTRLKAPPGFLEAATAGSAFRAEEHDFRFQISRPDNTPRLDVLVVAKAQPGLIPSDWFTGRVPRLPGDPLPAQSGIAVDTLDGAEPLDGEGAASAASEELPPGFVADDPDLGGSDLPDLDDVPLEETDPSAPAVDGEAPIENLAR